MALLIVTTTKRIAKEERKMKNEAAKNRAIPGLDGIARVQNNELEESKLRHPAAALAVHRQPPPPHPSQDVLFFHCSCEGVSRQLLLPVCS